MKRFAYVVLFLVLSFAAMAATAITPIDGIAAGGDLTGTYPSPTLAATAVTPGTYGSASQSIVFTVDGKGRVTASGVATITPAAIGAPTLTGVGASGTWGIGITGTALNITAASNSTLTTLSALSLPSSQVTGLGTLATLNAAPAGTLTGTTLASNVVTSSLTAVGTIISGIWNGTAINLTNYASGTLQAAQEPAHTGDVTNTAGSLVMTLPTVNSNIGTFQGITINAKGQVTAATNQNYLTGNQTITLSGDVSGSGTTAITGTLATVNSNTGSFGSSTAIPMLTVNGKGLVTAVSTATVVAPISTLTGAGTGVLTALGNALNAAAGLVGYSGALGTPISGVATNLTGTAAGLTAGTVTTNAPLTGPITSTGNATTIASQTGTGTQFVMSASPTVTGTMNGAAVVWSGANTALNYSATGTGANTLPVGTTGQRPSPTEGNIRDNSTTRAVEAYLNGAWQTVLSSATGVLGLAGGGTGATNAATAWYNLNGNGANGSTASFNAYCAAFNLTCTSGDQTTNKQNFYLAAQTVIYGQISSELNFDNAGSAAPSQMITAIVEPQQTMVVSSPAVCPDHVRCEERGTTYPNSTATLTSPCTATNWDGSSCGELNNLYQPMLIGAYGSDISAVNLFAKNTDGTGQRSGFTYGRTWEVGGIRSIGTAGTGYTNGEIAYLANPSGSQLGTKGTLTVSGGTVTGFTMASSSRWNNLNGEYQLPPALGVQQWSSAAFIAASGYTTFGAAGAGCFKIIGQTSGASNACAFVSWWPDWCSGSSGGSGNSFYISCTLSTTYAGTFSGKSGTLAPNLGNIIVSQAGTANDATQFGAMFAVMNTNTNTQQSGQANLQGGYYGWQGYGVDFRGDIVNPVSSAYGYRLSAGQQHYNQMIVDTPSTGCGIIGGQTGSSASGWSIATQQCFENASGSALTDYAWSYDQGSAASQGIAGLGIQDSLTSNTGSTKAAMHIDYWMSGNWVRHKVANFKGNAAATANQITTAFSFGTHNLANGANVIEGSIDNVAGAIWSGTWPVGFGALYWDAYANGWIFGSGTYQMYGAGAPTSGGSGTGLNKAGIGSLYVDTSNGALYVNQTAATSPTWETSCRVVSLGAAGWSNTGLGTTEQNLVSVALPPLGANDALRITATWTRAGTLTDTDNLIIREGTTGCTPQSACSSGGAVVNGSFTTTSQATVQTPAFVANRGATNSQVAWVASSPGNVSSSGSPYTGAIQTNATPFINFDCTTATSSADTCKLESYMIERCTN